MTPELALGLGRACADQAASILVGHDARTTGPGLARAFAAGALAGGAEVHNAGIAPTPTIAFGARDHELGVVITASHNPAPDNGFKFWRPDGAALDEAGRKRILAALGTPPELAAWNAVGRIREAHGLTQAYLEQLLATHGPLADDPRIVVDPGNGAASALTPELITRAGARTIALNATPDGTFPARPSEPTATNLAQLSATVQATEAVCGLANDGDADRCVAVDETGRVISGDQTIVLLAKALEAQTIAVPVNTSRLVWDALPDTRIEVTPVGDAHVSEHLARIQGAYGGEPSGAHILPSVSLCPDGPHAALVLAHLAAEHGGLAELVDALPRYETRRESIPCPEATKQAAMARIHTSLSAQGEVQALDGVRLDTDDGWVLVRPSGTEPKLRITAEAQDPAGADGLLAMAQGVVDQALHEVAPS